MSAPLVRKLAYEMAGAFFDNADVLNQDARQRSARFRKECKDQPEFIAKHWPKFVPMARKVLTHQLNDPHKPEKEKELIFQALLSDRGFATEQHAAILRPILIN